MHTNYVNGAAVTSDISVGPPDGSSWRSILVGSLHGGGRGFYALDVTDPANPTFLWEFTYTQTADHALKMDDNVGYSFAEPKIGKRPTDGKWVVFLTSGYNNVIPGDGLGWIFELDPISGAVLQQSQTHWPGLLAPRVVWQRSSSTPMPPKGIIPRNTYMAGIWRATSGVLTCQTIAC